MGDSGYILIPNLSDQLASKLQRILLVNFGETRRACNKLTSPKVVDVMLEADIK